MGKKRVILYAARFMNIYTDIAKCLEYMNFDVLWIEANTIPNNPFNKTLGLYNQKNIDDYMTQAENKWKALMDEDNLKNPIDYFVSIVGIDVPPIIFEELRKRNPNMRMVLYLYDRVEGVYQIDGFFKYYDEVFSFDKSDCNQYKLSFLPIYWVPSAITTNDIKYDIFAFASYSVLKQERTTLFSSLKRHSRRNRYRDYIKLYDKSYGLNKYDFIVRNISKTLLGRNTLTLKDVLNGLITGTSVTPDAYRQLINSSRVVLDTQASYQDGLTARFMWALGSGKKIITTNVHAREYDFYNEKQIFILDNNADTIDHFLIESFTPDSLQVKLVEPYRIDNWVCRILNIDNMCNH